MTENNLENSNERIAKVIAKSGVCTKREAERLILAGRVKLDGEVVTSPVCFVDINANISIDDKKIPARVEFTPHLWIYHKPVGEIVSHSDTHGRVSVFDTLHKKYNLEGRILSVGRLDLNSQGLLLITNSGEIARRLELPSNGFLRIYRVRVFGNLDPNQIRSLEKGITIEGVNYGPIKVIVGKSEGANTWCEFHLHEGKNREIRKVCAHFNLQVNKLIRQNFGPYKLENLPSQGLKEVEILC
jgi:23S rRNA pseudouridine2605 synthase